MNKENYIGLTCFACPTEFAHVEQLCKHIQNVHKIRGQNNYQCKLCGSVLGESDVFKRHLERCQRKFRKRNLRPTGDVLNNEEIEDFPNNGGMNLGQFEESIQDSVLKFVVKLSSNMAVPRNSVFEIIDGFRQDVIAAITEGIKNVFVPIVQNNDKEQVNAFVQLCESAFCYTETEFKLDSALKKKDLLSPVRKFPIGEKKLNIAEESSNEAYLNVESDAELDVSFESNLVTDEFFFEIASGDESDTRFDCDDARKKISTGTMMPIQFQLRKFFEEKEVFKTLIDHAKKIENGNELSHFINGSLWKSKLSTFSNEQIVIPYHLYNDETQINNVLGTHCKPGLESCVYYTFPTIPPQYASRLQNIFVAMMFSASDTTDHGPNCCFEELVKELNILAREGIKITIDGKEEVVFFVLGLFLGDNANLNKVLGFNGFSDTFFCKHCKMDKKQTTTATIEVPSLIRTEENYAEDLSANNNKITGIKWYSIFNTIAFFHVIHSAGVDIMHDINEGVLRYNMCAMLLYFIEKKFFTLKTLNNRRRNFVYDYPDRGNRSSGITRKHIKKGKLKMTASEMMTFFHNFGFLVGDLVSTEDKVWKFYLKTVEVVDLIFLTSYSESDLHKLEISISEMNQMYVTLFNQTLKPKHHNLTHYPRLTRLFGPLRYISSMRFEAKHRMVKKYTKNIESRRNVSFSIGRKLQYDYANMLLSGSGLKDKLEFKQTSVLVLSKQDFFSSIEKSQVLNEVADAEMFETDCLTMNGIFFENDLFIPMRGDNGEIKVLKIYTVLLLSRGSQQSPFVLCKEYSGTSWCTHYASYETTVLNLKGKMVLKSVSDLLDAHTLPISSHIFKGKEMFRLRNN